MELKRRFIDIQSGNETESLSMQTNLKLDFHMIPIYLTIGFIPGYRTLFKDKYYIPADSEVKIKDNKLIVKRRWRWEDFIINDFHNYTEDVLIKKGIDCWRQAVTNQYESNAEHVVALSGGLDSRAILAALLEHRSASRIYTYTYGMPGLLDYEIGNLIAKRIGTRHFSFNLTKYQFNQDRLEEIADRSDGNINGFEHAPWEWISKAFGWNANHWIGYMGDPLAGSHIPSALNDRISILDYFLKKNQVVSNVDFDRLGSGYSFYFNKKEFKKMFEEMYNFTNVYDVTAHEFADFYNRQERYINQIVFLRGLNYKTPFFDPVWASFILSVPRKWRIQQKLYKLILLKEFPKLFQLPVKSCDGLPLNSSIYRKFQRKVNLKIRNPVSRFIRLPNPTLNYIDFREGIRNREDLRKVILNNLNSLGRRNLFNEEELKDLLNKHLTGKYDNSKILQLLVSLEVIIQCFNVDVHI